MIAELPAFVYQSGTTLVYRSLRAGVYRDSVGRSAVLSLDRGGRHPEHPLWPAKLHKHTGECMRTAIRALLCHLLLSVALLATTAQGQEFTKPQVRAVTAFVRLNRPAYTQQINDALTVLQRARQEFVKQGYQVQTVRIVTQPLGELVAGLSPAEAMSFLKTLDDLSAKQDFFLNVGPAMLRDSDDPQVMRLMERALATLPHLMGSAIIAGEDGIHWKVIHETAALVHYVAQNSPHGQGNFHFTATAMLQPYGPFFPGSYHTGAGRQLSFGFQSANVVQQVFARTNSDFARSVAELTRQLSVHARAAEKIGQQVAAASNWTFMG